MVPRSKTNVYTIVTAALSKLGVFTSIKILKYLPILLLSGYGYPPMLLRGSVSEPGNTSTLLCRKEPKKVHCPAHFHRFCDLSVLHQTLPRDLLILHVLLLE